METDLISIVVPVYNVEKYLEKSIESIINQTYKNIEIIIVDDGSTDNCGKICDQYKQKDERIVVLHKENGGLSDARNRGIDLAKGKYITFVDSDDTIEKDYVEYLKSIILDNPLAICSYSIISKNKLLDCGKNYNDCILNKEECFKRLLMDEGFSVSACAKLYRIELFDNVRFPKGKICEDIGTTYKVIDQCSHISYGHKSKYNYFRHSNSIMRSSFSKRKLDMIFFTDEMCNYIVEKYENLISYANNRKIYARLSILRQISESNNFKDNKELINDIKKEIDEIDKSNLNLKEKIAIISLKISFSFFSFVWKIFKYIKYKE